MGNKCRFEKKLNPVLRKSKNIRNRADIVDTTKHGRFGDGNILSVQTKICYWDYDSIAKPRAVLLLPLD
jgi:hypothetical protein